MIKFIHDSFEKLEKVTSKIMHNGFLFCFIFPIFSAFILFTYKYFSLSPTIYYIGIALIKLCFYLFIDFIICGFVVDNIKKHAI